MTKRIVSGLALGAALVLTSGIAEAQRPVTLGVSGGIAVPTSDLGDRQKTGGNVAVGLGFGFPMTNFGIRFEGFYNGFPAKTGSSGLSIAGGSVNGVYNLGGAVVRPYVIGGVGAYNSKFKGGESSTDFGINAGVGLKFGLGALNAFTEARLHSFERDNDSFQFIPITFGIEF